MKTNYKKLAEQIRNDLVNIYQCSIPDAIREYWNAKMGELEELDPDFNERKLKQLVFEDQRILN